MIVICVLKEFLITINLPFFEKQKTIIVMLASVSQTCYQKRKALNAEKRMSLLSSFISSILWGKKALSNLINKVQFGFIFS